MDTLCQFINIKGGLGCGWKSGHMVQLPECFFFLVKGFSSWHEENLPEQEYWL
jgi:hypothetical protein